MNSQIMKHVKIEIKRRSNGDSLVATADLIIDSTHRIRNFTIRKSQFAGGDGFAVYPPQIKIGDRWLWQYVCEDKQAWKELKNAIVNKYNEVLFDFGVQELTDAKVL